MASSLPWQDVSRSLKPGYRPPMMSTCTTKHSGDFISPDGQMQTPPPIALSFNLPSHWLQSISSPLRMLCSGMLQTLRNVCHALEGKTAARRNKIQQLIKHTGRKLNTNLHFWQIHPKPWVGNKGHFEETGKCHSTNFPLD